MAKRIGFNLELVGATFVHQYAGTLLSLAPLIWLETILQPGFTKNGNAITPFASYVITGRALPVFHFTVQAAPVICGLIVLHLVFIIWFGNY